MAKNIEDTIFDDGLACNINPMISRLQEIIADCQKNGKDYRKDTRAKKLMWLLNATFYQTQSGTIDMEKTWRDLKEEQTTP